MDNKNITNRLSRIYEGRQLDSDEEFLFLCWCRDALELGLLNSVGGDYTFKLSDRVSETFEAPTKRNPDKKIDKFLLHPHVYTTDFVLGMVECLDKHGNRDILLNRLLKDKWHPYYIDDVCYCFVDVKGGFLGARHGSSSDVSFPINRKWVYQKYRCFINKAQISPKRGLFTQTWVPDEGFVTAKGNPSKRYRKCKTFKEMKEKYAAEIVR